MNKPFNKSSQAELTEVINSDQGISHVEFASIVLASRWQALNLSLDQVREMAAAILVLDHRLDEAEDRMMSMLASIEPINEVSTQQKPAKVKAPEVVAIPIGTPRNKAVSDALEALVVAHHQLTEAKYASGEFTARQKFERAAVAVVTACTQIKGKRR